MNSLFNLPSFATSGTITKSSKIIFVLLFILVTYLSLTTRPETNESGAAVLRWLSALLFSVPDYADKIAHFLAYGALGFFAAGARFTAIDKIWILFIALSGYGVVMEYFQLVGGVRDPDFWDAMTNAGGAFFGILGFFIFVVIIGKFYRPKLQ